MELAFKKNTSIAEELRHVDANLGLKIGVSHDVVVREPKKADGSAVRISWKRQLASRQAAEANQLILGKTPKTCVVASHPFGVPEGLS